MRAGCSILVQPREGCLSTGVVRYQRSRVTMSLCKPVSSGHGSFLGSGLSGVARNPGNVSLGLLVSTGQVSVNPTVCRDKNRHGSGGTVSPRRHVPAPTREGRRDCFMSGIPPTICRFLPVFFLDVRCSWTLVPCIRSHESGHMVVCVVTDHMVGDRRSPGATILGGRDYLPPPPTIAYQSRRQVFWDFGSLHLKALRRPWPTVWMDQGTERAVVHFVCRHFWTTVPVLRCAHEPTGRGLVVTVRWTSWT